MGGLQQGFSVTPSGTPCTAFHRTDASVAPHQASPLRAQVLALEKHKNTVLLAPSAYAESAISYIVYS
ncbi:MAG: hypothetical protein ACTS6O_12190, partial [Giesbergeria sp.]